ncbi:MAG: aminotransferase, partial [Halocynthiibacter sp.]
GCLCAGPYGHRLLGIDRTTSENLRREVLAGNGMNKPGWVRLNFSYLMDDKTAHYIINSVNELSRTFEQAAARYHSATPEFMTKQALPVGA